jgi:hypothetical protein
MTVVFGPLVPSQLQILDPKKKGAAGESRPDDQDQKFSFNANWKIRGSNVSVIWPNDDALIF